MTRMVESAVAVLSLPPAIAYAVSIRLWDWLVMKIPFTIEQEIEMLPFFRVPQDLGKLKRHMGRGRLRAGCVLLKLNHQRHIFWVEGNLWMLGDAGRRLLRDRGIFVSANGVRVELSPATETPSMPLVRQIGQRRPDQAAVSSGRGPRSRSFKVTMVTLKKTKRSEEF